MINDLTIFVNSHSSADDALRVFIFQLEKHWPNHPPIVIGRDGLMYVFPKCGYTVVDYSAAKQFTSQYLMGLCAVETPYALTMQEDFILFGDVDEAGIDGAMDDLNNAYSARLIDSGRELTYSMQATVWDSHVLRLIYALIDAASPWEAELCADLIFRDFGRSRELCKLRHDDHLPMRGRNHRDSPIFPYISTALVRGKWNHEYRNELTPLLEQYGIDAEKRGWSA